MGIVKKLIMPSYDFKEKALKEDYHPLCGYFDLFILWVNNYLILIKPTAILILLFFTIDLCKLQKPLSTNNIFYLVLRLLY